MRLSCVVVLVLMIPALSRADERVRQWQADVAALRDQLEQVHPRFATCGLSQDLRDRFAELSARIPLLDDAQITVRMQAILATVGDGHTLLWPFGMSRGQLLRIPVQFWWFDDGIFVVNAARADLIGRRVVKIGSVSSDEVMRRLTRYVSHDNDMQLRWAVPLYATLTDFLVAGGAITDRMRVQLTFDDGRTVVLTAVTVEGRDLDTRLPVPPHRVPLYLSHRDDPFWSTLLPDGTAYVQLNAINDANGETLAQFGRELKLKLAKTDRAILDLRLNNGGDARKANEVLKTLIAYDVRGARLAILTSRMTFSAAQTLATRLDEWTTGSFIGEATGSRPNHYGNERPFKLPNSQIRGTIASGMNQPISAHDDRVTILPDLAIPWRAEDYFSGTDPVLDAAVKRLAH
jgi:hypothetical protein